MFECPAGTVFDIKVGYLYSISLINSERDGGAINYTGTERFLNMYFIKSQLVGMHNQYLNFSTNKLERMMNSF